MLMYNHDQHHDSITLLDGDFKMGSIFKKPKTPKLEPVKVAPVTDDKESKRKSQMDAARKYGGTGRQGTILSEGSKLG